MEIGKDFVLYESKNSKVFIMWMGFLNKDNKTHFFNICKNINPNDHYPEDILGQIKWNGSWRKYTCFLDKDTMWDEKCGLLLFNWLKKLNETHKLGYLTAEKLGLN